MRATGILAICALTIGFAAQAHADNLTAKVTIANSSTSGTLILGYYSGATPPATIAPANGSGDITAVGTASNVSNFMIYKTTAGNGCTINVTSVLTNGRCTYSSFTTNPIGTASCSVGTQSSEPASCDGHLYVNVTAQ